MTDVQFDYAIIGAGAAGLQLVSAMASDAFFDDKKIAIIDKDLKTTNDKIWCFWEKGKGKWDEILDYSWDDGKFYSSDGTEINLKLHPYKYKKLKSIDFYQHVNLQIAAKKNITQFQAEVLDVSELNSEIIIKTATQTFRCKHCFDSRMPEAIQKTDDTYIKLYQHFKGWSVKFKEPVFDPSTFTMMDFRLQDGETTSFTYILPTSDCEALIEFTYFTDELVEDQVYEQHIAAYIENQIGNQNFVISESEYGVIPMTDYPFHEANDDLVTKIGTAGSWVRGSTGYSFRNAMVKVQQIIENIKAGRRPSDHLFKAKNLWYDKILLGVLKDTNHLGPKVFHEMYAKNSIQQIFKFLDGETSLAEDLKIIGSLPKLPFIKSLLR